MQPLESRIHYKFRNSLLLAEALTHPSLAYESQKPHFDNQRLEFLGDAVIQLVVTEQLYRMLPEFPEGHLTKLRSRIVSRNALARSAGFKSVCRTSACTDACCRPRAASVAAAVMRLDLLPPRRWPSTVSPARTGLTNEGARRADGEAADLAAEEEAEGFAMTDPAKR